VKSLRQSGNLKEMPKIEEKLKSSAIEARCFRVAAHSHLVKGGVQDITPNLWQSDLALIEYSSI